MADIAIPHGLAAAVLVTLTKRDGRWVDEDELVDLVRCQYSDALGAFPNEGAHAADIMDAASALAGGGLINEDPVHGAAHAENTSYAWRLRRG
jgi:hypothetical protein